VRNYEQDRAKIGELAAKVQEATGEKAAAQAGAHGMRLEVVKLAEVRKGFVLLPRRRVVERSFGWAARVSATGTRLRTPAGDIGGTAFSGIRRADARTIRRFDGLKFITRSTQRGIPVFNRDVGQVNINRKPWHLPDEQIDRCSLVVFSRATSGKTLNKSATCFL
jgi:hypothetical protein